MDAHLSTVDFPPRGLKKDLSDPYGKKKVRGWEIFEKTLPRGHRESISSSMKFIIKKYFSYDDPISDIPISISDIDPPL